MDGKRWWLCRVTRDEASDHRSVSANTAAAFRNGEWRESNNRQRSAWNNKTLIELMFNADSQIWGTLSGYWMKLLSVQPVSPAAVSNHSACFCFFCLVSSGWWLPTWCITAIAPRPKPLPNPQTRPCTRSWPPSKTDRVSLNKADGAGLKTETRLESEHLF